MKKSLEYKVFNAIALIFTTIFAIVCVLPVLFTLSGSFMTDRELFGGLKLIPDNPTLNAYKQILKNAESMMRAYGITIFITVLCAKLVGCTLPILAKKIGLDPAVMASPFITTIVDAISLVIFFALAMLMLL